MNEDPRADRLVRRLEGPLDGASTRAAEERVWRSVKQAASTRRTGSGLLPAFAAIAGAVLLLFAGLWLGSYRLDVASGRLPILYREEVAHVDVPTRLGVSGTLDIAQGHFSASTPTQLSVVAIADVRLGTDALPATVEIRYRDLAAATAGVLARTADVSDTRRATGEYRYDVTAPFPPLERGAVRRYEVWIHVETPEGLVESPIVTVEVTGAAEGQRARVLEINREAR